MNVIKPMLSDNHKISENFETARRKRHVVMMETKMMRNCPYGVNLLREETVMKEKVEN